DGEGDEGRRRNRVSGRLLGLRRRLRATDEDRQGESQRGADGDGFMVHGDSPESHGLTDWMTSNLKPVGAEATSRPERVRPKKVTLRLSSTTMLPVSRSIPNWSMSEIGGTPNCALDIRFRPRMVRLPLTGTVPESGSTRGGGTRVPESARV